MTNNIFKYFGNTFLANGGILGRKIVGLPSILLGKCKAMVKTLYSKSEILFTETKARILSTETKVKLSNE